MSVWFVYHGKLNYKNFSHLFKFFVHVDKRLLQALFCMNIHVKTKGVKEDMS